MADRPKTTDPLARIAELEREADQWMERAYYEVGGVPFMWEDRALAAERKLQEYGHDDWYCGGTLPGTFQPVPSWRQLYQRVQQLEGKVTRLGGNPHE